MPSKPAHPTETCLGAFQNFLFIPANSEIPQEDLAPLFLLMFGLMSTLTGKTVSGRGISLHLESVTINF